MSFRSGEYDEKLSVIRRSMEEMVPKHPPKMSAVLRPSFLGFCKSDAVLKHIIYAEEAKRSVNGLCNCSIITKLESFKTHIGRHVV